MAGYWRPSKDNYLGRITRDQLLALGRDMLGEAWAQSRGSDKKASLVDQLDRPSPIRTSHGRTPEQVEKLKSWLPAGMAFSHRRRRRNRPRPRKPGRPLNRKPGAGTNVRPHMKGFSL